MAGFTKRQYREAVAQFFGLHDSTATGGSTTTIVDTKLTRFADDFFNGTQVYLPTTGASAWVTDFVSATGTLTVAPALTGAGSGTRYQIFFRVTKDDIDNALAFAVAGQELAVTLTPANDTTDYLLTDENLFLRRQQIIGVFYRERGDKLNPVEEITGWTFDGANMVLHLPYELNEADDLWLIYHASEDSITDASVCALPLALVRARAIVHLLENRLNNTVDRDWYGTQLRYWGEKLTLLERQYQRPSNKVQGVNWDAATGDRARPSPWNLIDKIVVDDGEFLLNE